MHFSFSTSTQIIFGKNAALQLPGLIAKMGSRLLLVTGKNHQRITKITESFSKSVFIKEFKIEYEPNIETINAGVELARKSKCNIVVGIGGGSVIDGAKAIAAIVPNKRNLLDYLEVIGKGMPLENKPLPFIAVPTTAGTGAEVTKNAVIKSLEKKVKVSLRSNLMFPDVAVVDPVLTYSMPPALTASTGVDALTHLLETFVSNQSNAFVDTLCREGLQRISRSLKIAFSDGNDKQAREDMAMASMLGGMALANVKLGAIHGFAGPMGGMFPIPHGAVCACLMPAVIETNIDALKAQNLPLRKYEKLAVLLTGNINAKAEDAAEWTADLVKELKIPSLSTFGLTKNDFPELVQKAKNASSMKGNPVQLSNEQLTTILTKSL